MSRNTFAERLLEIARHTVAHPLTVSTTLAPSLRRMFMTWSFMAHSPEVGSAGSMAPLAEASSPRESTRPGRSMRAASTSNSVRVSSTGTPSREASREAGSRTTSCQKCYVP